MVIHCAEQKTQSKEFRDRFIKAHHWGPTHQSLLESQTKESSQFINNLMFGLSHPMVSLPVICSKQSKQKQKQWLEHSGQNVIYIVFILLYWSWFLQSHYKEWGVCQSRISSDILKLWLMPGQVIFTYLFFTFFPSHFFNTWTNM